LDAEYYFRMGMASVSQCESKLQMTAQQHTMKHRLITGGIMLINPRSWRRVSHSKPVRPIILIPAPVLMEKARHFLPSDWVREKWNICYLIVIISKPLQSDFFAPHLATPSRYKAGHCYYAKLFLESGSRLRQACCSLIYGCKTSQTG
jgi:hypothetical protein